MPTKYNTSLDWHMKKGRFVLVIYDPESTTNIEFTMNTHNHQKADQMACAIIEVLDAMTRDEFDKHY